MFRAVLSELKMRPSEWPDLVPVLQSALNSAPSPQRKNLSPITIFTGLNPTDPLQTFTREANGAVFTLTEAQFEVFKI